MPDVSGLSVDQLRKLADVPVLCRAVNRLLAELRSPEEAYAAHSSST